MKSRLSMLIILLSIILIFYSIYLSKFNDSTVKSEKSNTVIDPTSEKEGNEIVDDINNIITESNEIENHFPSVNDVSLENINSVITQISSEPRGMNTSGILTAKNVIVDALESYRYNTSIQTFDIYKQDKNCTNVKEFAQDYFLLNPFESDPIGTGENIIAFKELDNNKPTLYITAHYDSTNDTLGIIDNGSGTAVCVELARLFKDYQFDFNIIYVFFASE